MTSLRRFLIVTIATAAVLQWLVVLERATAAVWAWYEFVGYGGGGHIVVGHTIQAVFLVASAVVAVIGYALSNAERQGGDSRVWQYLAQFGWVSIAICTSFWMALLLSPLVTFRRT